MSDETQAPASRATDAAVAEAMGYRVSMQWPDGASVKAGKVKDFPHYSTDWAAMEEVVAWIEAQGWGPFIFRHPLVWSVSANKHGSGQRRAEAPSLPLAVCRLALAVAKGEGNLTEGREV